MDIEFNKISDFKRGIIFDLLSDAYSFDKNYITDTSITKFHESDNFFFDNLDIADSCGFITTLKNEAIGFICWDPRNTPEYAIIGDNCIISKYKGKGYGKLQLQEAINRITRNCVKKIFVSTDKALVSAQKMYESVGFIRLDNSTLEQWQISQNQDIYYGIDISLNMNIRKVSINEYKQINELFWQSDSFHYDNEPYIRKTIQ